MKAVFADAFYLVGLVNRADQHHAQVVAAARRLRDRIVTITDCISFVVMKDEGIHDALTGDGHFEQAVFNALLK